MCRFIFWKIREGFRKKKEVKCQSFRVVRHLGLSHLYFCLFLAFSLTKISEKHTKSSSLGNWKILAMLPAK